MDDHTNFEVVDSLWSRIDLNVQSKDRTRHLNTVSGTDGRQYSYYGLGGPLAYFPFYALGRLAGQAHGSVHYLAQAGMSLTNAFATACTAMLIFMVMVRLGRPARASGLAALLYAFMTPAFVWSKHQSNSVLVGLLFLLAFRLLLESHWKWHVLGGGILGFSVNVRYDAIIGVILVIAGVNFILKRWDVRSSAALLVGSFPFAILLLAYNAFRFGSPWALGYPDLETAGQFRASILSGLFGLLISSNRGLLIYGPVLWLVPIAWRRVVTNGKWRELSVYAGIPLVYCFFFATLATWHGGMGWGPRYLACALPFLCCCMADLFPFHGKFRSLAMGLALLSLAIQLWGGLVSIDSYHDYLVENGIDPLLSATHVEYSPLWEIRHVALQFDLSRLPDALTDAPLPAGGYPATKALRATPDFWPFYAYKVGIPWPWCLALWSGVFICGLLVLRRAVAILK